MSKLFDLDSFIDRHLHSSKVINGKYLKYTPDELMELCRVSIETMGKEPPLVKLNPPCVIVGDIHGQYYDLLRMFSFNSTGKTTGALAKKYMFLGDYVDRGRHSLECLCVVLALKCRFPDKYQVLRGNHECITINRVYGFYDEIMDRFGKQDGEPLWEKFNEVFSWMPLAGLVGSKILCMHGGISPELQSLDCIAKLPRPLVEASSMTLALDLMWADPMINISGYRPNSVRGVSVFFGEDEVHKACTRLGVNLIVRGHQMMTSGFGMFADRKLMTVFTAPRYQADNPNAGASLTVDANGRIGLHILQPKDNQDTDEAEPGTDSASCFFNREDEGTQAMNNKKKGKPGSKGGSKAPSSKAPSTKASASSTSQSTSKVK